MSLKLVLHHAYQRGNAFDLSKHGHHGRLTAVVAGSPGTLRFSGGPSRVDVVPGAELSGMRELHIRVRFLIDPNAAPPQHRHNLVEGYLSFALHAEGDLSLRATILDATGAWSGTQTAPGVIVPGTWQTADYFHDGISRARLYLDGALVAESFDVPGPIRDMGDLGLAIGHWPDPDDRYTLEGELDDVKLWRDDLIEDTRDKVDACCVNRAGLDELARRAREDGWDANMLGGLVQEVLGLGTEVAIAARGGDAVRTTELVGLTRDASLSAGQRDLTGLADALGRIDGFLKAHIPAADLEAYGNRALDQVRGSPLASVVFGDDDGDRGLVLERLRPLAEVLCLDELLPPRKPDREPPRRPQRPEGDPATDYEPGHPPPDWVLGGEDSGGKEPPPPRQPEPDPDKPQEPMWRPFDHDILHPTGPSEPPQDEDG